MEKLDDKFLFNFLALNRENAADIMEAGLGYIVPGIVSDQFEKVEEAVRKVKELRTVTPFISVGLGGGGNTGNWKKVLDISAQSEPGHLNQPFETAAYAKGYLTANHSGAQVVNALVKPTGIVGKVETASGMVLTVEEFVEIAASQQIESIKMMPVKGDEHLDELIYLTRQAGNYGIRGVEPAGGINVMNIKAIIEGVRAIDIEFFMPHIFGSTIDKETGKTIPEEVHKILKEVGAANHDA